MAELIQWEYRVLSTGGFLSGPKDSRLEDLLNELGLEGWEVVGLTQRENTGKMTVVAKRPLTVSVRRQRSLFVNP